jgi:2'-phosphotransferase
MSRCHIHFEFYYPSKNNIISGSMNDCGIFNELNIKLVINNGIKIYKSINDVILTEGINSIIESLYFKKNVYIK